jgi:antitoxin (DNA-binding transcriptional repressor) of toxin-antitoxin stability system
MREIALYEAKNTLSSLIADIEASGEEIVITRHGMPAARLSPIVRVMTVQEKAAILSQIAANRDAWARDNPQKGDAPTWEEIKAWMDEDR